MKKLTLLCATSAPVEDRGLVEAASLGRRLQSASASYSNST